MRRLLSFIVVICSICTAYSQSALPEITIISSHFDHNVENLYIEYSIADGDDTVFTVEAILSNDGGSRFDFPVSSTSGDIGADIVKDGNKQAIIGCSGIDPMNTVVRLIVADDDTLDIQAVVDQVDSTRLWQRLLDVEGIRNRDAGPAHLDSVRHLIRSSLDSSGPDSQVYPFLFNGYEGQNIIGTQSGIGDPHSEYYVGGHYDSEPNTPGADDNGTAIAAMLEAAHVLGGFTFDKTIRYAAWDLEEEGLIGSLNYVNGDLSYPEDIEGYLNFEMIGYYKETPNTQSLPFGFNFLFPAAYQEIETNEFRGDFLTNVGNEANSMELMEGFEQTASQYVSELSVISIASPGNGSTVPDLLRSDHASFWLQSIPAVMLTDGANFRNPNYHTPTDVSDSLDIRFLTNNTKAAVAFLAANSDYNHAAFVDIDSIEIMSGIGQIETARELNIFPVPAGDEIRLQLNADELSKIDRIIIYSPDGKLIKQVDRPIFESNISSVSVRDIPEGNYLIYADVEGEIRVGKIVVAR